MPLPLSAPGPSRSFAPRGERQSRKALVGWAPVRSASGQGLAMDGQGENQPAAPGGPPGPCRWVRLLGSRIGEAARGAAASGLPRTSVFQFSQLYEGLSTSGFWGFDFTLFESQFHCLKKGVTFPPPNDLKGRMALSRAGRADGALACALDHRSQCGAGSRLACPPRAGVGVACGGWAL